MKTIHFILTAFILFLTSCNEQRRSENSTASFNNTATFFKKEYPKSENGDFDLFYKLTKEKQNQLGLSSLENGFDNLQIRVWYDSSRAGGRERKLIIITNTGSNRTAKINSMILAWIGQCEIIESRNIRFVTPRSGWTIFLAEKQYPNVKVSKRIILDYIEENYTV